MPFKQMLEQKGLSLIETMVALAIVSIAFTGLMQSFPFSLTINKTTESATKASYLAQSKIEELYSQGYDDMGVGTIEIKHRLSENSSNYLYYFQRETVVNYVDDNLQNIGNDAGLKKISVTVYYTNSISKTEKNYNVTTLINQW